MIHPTGDKTGAADYSAISDCLSRDGAVSLSPGEFWLKDPLIVSGDGFSLRGSGYRTVIRPVLNSNSIIEFSSTENASISDMLLLGGNDSLVLRRAWRTNMSDVYFRAPRIAAIAVMQGSLITSVTGCRVYSPGVAGIEVRGVVPGTGNALSVVGSSIEWSKGDGIAWSGHGLSLSGCTIEGCGGVGLRIDGDSRVSAGVSVAGCYFESNKSGEIALSGMVASGVHGVSITGCFFHSSGKQASIVCRGETGEVRRLVVDRSNFFGSEPGSLNIDASDCCRMSELYVKSPELIRCLNQAQNRITIGL